MTTKLRVSGSQRYLVHHDGTPFFYLGDTAWELFHRLNREEADQYLTTRASQHFTVIQAVVLAEFDGLHTPNAYGHCPLQDDDPTRPNEEYFAHVDWVVNRAEELGLWTGMLPTWGDKWHAKWGVGPVVFTLENARTYGEYVGARYRDKPIIWILGGDRPAETDEHKEIIRAMAEGIRKGDNGEHLITFHPRGGNSSSDFVHAQPWLAFNMFQSGHCGRDNPNYDMLARDYALSPVKPTMDGEPCYEDHPVMGDGWKFVPENGYFDGYSARKAVYWALFAGACGHTYGCHPVWQMWDPKKREKENNARTPWQEALHLPGAEQMQHARALLESRPFLERIPDQSMIVSEIGMESDHVQATRAQDGPYAFVYVPSGKPVTIDFQELSGEKLDAWWYDPRSGASKRIDQIRKRGAEQFTPPSDGPDWVLVLDDASKQFTEPGASKI